MEWRASHILMKEKALADQVLKKLKSGGRFEALAKEFSTCPSSSKGGDLGWFGPGKMVRQFEEAVIKLRQGKVTGLGDIGPEAAKPVMEGKSVLFKRFAGIDSVDLEIRRGK